VLLRPLLIKADMDRNASSIAATAADEPARLIAIDLVTARGGKPSSCDGDPDRSFALNTTTRSTMPSASACQPT